MRAILTGAAGMIGSHLAEKLIEAGLEIVAIDNLSTGRRENLSRARKMAEERGLYFRLIVTDAGRAIWHVIERADIVFHLAAVVGVERVMARPGAVLVDMHRATSEVIEACTVNQVRLVMASSSEVYGRSEAVPFREDQDCQIGPPTNPRGSYALIKLAEEYLALENFRRYGLPVTIARLFNTVGPRQRADYGMVVPRFVRQALAQRPLTIHGDGWQTRCFANVRDVVRCLFLISQDGHEGQVFNIGSTQETAIKTLAELVIKLTGSKSTVVHEPGRDGDMQCRKPDVSKLRALCGCVPETPLGDTLQEIIDHERGGER